LEAKKAAEWTARQADQGALIAAKAVCKAGLTSAQITAQVQAKLLGTLKEKLAKALGANKTQQALRQAIDSTPVDSFLVQESVFLARFLGQVYLKRWAAT
jgi:hypothetical protein